MSGVRPQPPRWVRHLYFQIGCFLFWCLCVVALAITASASVFSGLFSVGITAVTGVAIGGIVPQTLALHRRWGRVRATERQSRNKRRYILVDGTHPVPMIDQEAWMNWWMANAATCQIGESVVSSPGGSECLVSTVFTGVSLGEEQGKPLLFETLIVGGPLHATRMAYLTREEADTGHTRFTQLVSDIVHELGEIAMGGDDGKH